jgi:hypothetical protein
MVTFTVAVGYIERNEEKNFHSLATPTNSTVEVRRIRL